MIYKCLKSFGGTPLVSYQPPSKTIWNALPFTPFPHYDSWKSYFKLRFFWPCCFHKPALTLSHSRNTAPPQPLLFIVLQCLSMVTVSGKVFYGEENHALPSVDVDDGTLSAKADQGFFHPTSVCCS